VTATRSQAALGHVTATRSQAALGHVTATRSQAAASAPHAARADPAAVREWLAPFRVDLPLTLSVHRRGGGDPAYRVDASGAIWRTCLTPEGPGTLRLTSRFSGAGPTGPGPAVPGPAVPGPGAGTLVTGQAWGPGAAWLLDTLPAQLGAHDDTTGFTAAHRAVAELVLRYQGLRVGRTLRVFEALVPAVLEQKVVGAEARRAWRILLEKFGTPAPGPAPHGMRVFPPPEVWARIPSWDWHQAGVEGVRARTIVVAAGAAARLEQVPELGAAEAERRLRSLPGIGAWTSAEIRQRAAGDPDAVSVGDYNLPRVVGWTLAGRITDDAGMLELLAPYVGHRYRVTRLIELGGAAPPRRGPRLPIRDYHAL
jgi:3-methyladenine DNA glycosylase/8-oxoguanine DNA glycosylase